MDGASASTVTGYVGNSSFAHNNRIVAEGEGTTFTSKDLLIVGWGGTSNRVDILDGASAELGATYIGYSNSAHNAMLIDGSNSTLTATELHLGESGQFNLFTVTNGAQASSGVSSIGTGTNGNGNVALVTGEGSFWDAGSLTIGGSEITNFNNSLTITNGGQVLVSELVISTNGTGNVLSLNERGWLTASSDFDAGMQGFEWAFDSNSTLEMQGVLSNTNEPSNNLYLGIHDNKNTLILSGGGIWSNEVNVTVGDNNSSNQLKLIDGGTIIAGNGVIGKFSGSDFNLVEVSGAGSIWSNSSSFTVGELGSDNLVSITNGGKVTSWGSTIGSGAGSDQNAVVVRGSGSRFTTEFGRLVVGYSGASNTLSALEGGLVTSGRGTVGLNSDNNRVLIDGAGSKWSMSSSFRIGESGSSNEVYILNDGVVSAANSTYLGFESGSDANALSVAGENSRLYTTLNIHVGHKGSGNRLSILNGAQVYNDIGLLGTDNGADNNRAIIDGTGSLWFNRHTFFAGNSGASNTVTIQNGATLADTTGYIGYHTNAIGNQVVVDGATWSNSDGLFVGFNGSGNSLVITNGAEVSSGESRIGAEGFANGNQVLVTGTGSVWNVSQSLMVGNDVGTNNMLVVENGGQVVVDKNITVGSNNWLNVNDGGTVSVYGNTLFTDGFNISSGGTFETFGGVSGLGGTLESGRTLRLSGSGASWNAPGDILVESGATLDIGAGALVSTPSNYTQQANATLRFGMATNSAGAPVSGSLAVGQVADFADGANFIFASDIGALSFDTTYSNTLVSAGTLVAGGQTNATTADLVTYLNTVGTLAGISFFVDGQDILALVNRIGLGDQFNPENEDLRAVLDEIDDRATAGDPLANRQLGIINAMSEQQANDELTQFYTRGIPTYQHMGGVLQGLRQIGKRTSAMLMETGAYEKPIGAYGPPLSERQWRGWVSVYGSQGTRDASSGLSGYDANTYGTVLGVDKSFNKVLVGLAGGTAGSTIDQDDGDTSEATTAYGALYATVRLKDVNLDLIGSYGSSSIESESGTTFGSDAEMDASTMVFYIGASEESISGPITVTPMIAFQAANYSQDGYDEVSTSAIGRAVDSYDRWSYQSILGVTVGSVKTMKKFDFITRVKASWQHEFNTDIETLDYTLIGGTDPHYFSIQAPVKDSFDLGISLGALFGDNLEFSLGLNGRYSKEFMAISYNGKIQYSF